MLVAPPGEEGFAAVGDGTLGMPGRYLVMCFIPTGADPAASLGAGRRAVLTSGMYAELAVR